MMVTGNSLNDSDYMTLTTKFSYFSFLRNLFITFIQKLF